MLKTAVIVPGFTESHRHFKLLCDQLEAEGFTVKFIMPWQITELQQEQGGAVFIGHSLGAYYLAFHKLTPSLLIGLPDQTLVRKYFGKSFLIIRRHAFLNQQRRAYSYHRLHNFYTFMKHFLPNIQLVYRFYRHKTELETKGDNIILLQNERDPMVKQVSHAIQAKGHHEDITYHPESYLKYIRQLANSEAS